MNVLSLYDGMACGMIAMKRGGYQVDSYDAYEIDKYAIQSATHNFPQIKEHEAVHFWSSIFPNSLHDLQVL